MYFLLLAENSHNRDVDEEMNSTSPTFIRGCQLPEIGARCKPLSEILGTD